MELFTRENFFGEGSERIDTVGVRGSKPLPRTIPKDGLLADACRMFTRGKQATRTNLLVASNNLSDD